MKKSLIIALAICLLFLVGCGSVAGTSPTSSTSASQATSTGTNASPQAVCSILQAQQARRIQALRSASARLSTAQGDREIVWQVEQTIIRLYKLIAQGKEALKACPTTP